MPAVSFAGAAAMIRVRFWGTRGSLPVALTAPAIKAKLAQVLVRAGGLRFADERAAADWLEREAPFDLACTYGGHSSCVELATGEDHYVLCDAGSGLRPFGQRVMAERGGRPGTYHLFMSHLHWDHIMGFPFFSPAYVPGNRIVIHGCHAELESAFRRQQDAPSFPVGFGQLGADIEFVRLEPGRPHRLAGFTVTPKLQLHAGDSYGYRFEREGRTVVYSTDSEHKLNDPEETRGFVDFFRDADLVIFDAMYSFADAVTVKQDWGHSSNVVGVELCQLAGARHLVLFHHEPVYDDARIEQALRETRRLEELTRDDHPRLEVSAAWDGLEIEV